MLKIKDVKYELENKGPGNGHPEISIYFEETETEEKTSIYEQLKDKVNEAGVTVIDAYGRACDGSQETFFKFNGSEMIKDENYDQLEEFLNGISKESLEVQKSLRELGKLKFGDFRPPYFIWEGKPEVITNKTAYELFNIPYAVIDNSDNVNNIALVQIMNHTYGKVYVDWLGNGKDAEFIDSLRDIFKFYKVTVISNEQNRKEAKEFCMKYGYVNYSYFEE